MDLSKYVPPLDLGPGMLFGILALVIVLLFAFSVGRTRILISLLAIYVAFSLQTVFPYFSKLQQLATFTKDLPTLRVIVFLILYALAFVLLNGSILRGRFSLGETSFLPVILMGVVQLGFILSIVFNLAPTFFSINERLPKDIIPYLATRQALFYWSLAPIVLLLFSRNKS